MLKNDNVNISLNQKKKLLDIEQRLLNEGIIFKRRILINRKENDNNKKRNSQHKNLSIKLTDKNIPKNEIKTNNSNLINSMRTKKKSFSGINNLSMNEFRKNRMKKNNSIKNYINNNKNNKIFAKSPNYRNKIILKYNSFNKNEKNSKKKNLNIIDLNSENIICYHNSSPKMPTNKLEKGQISPIERTQYYINTNRDKDEESEKQKFNYKKWNKITINNVNNVFDKDNINDMNEKENNGLIYNQNYININDNGIQEIYIPNIKKAKTKKAKINDIPHNKKKINNNIINNFINRNNAINHCKIMSNLILSKENKNNLSGEALNELNFDEIIEPPDIKNNNRRYNTNTFKSYRYPNKNSESFERKLIENKPRTKESFTTSLKHKNYSTKLLKKTIKTSKRKKNNNNSNYQNNKIYRNVIDSLNSNSNSESNNKIIKVNSILIDFIKNDDLYKNDNNKNKEIILNKNKDENIIKEKVLENKNKLFGNFNEEILYNNTDILKEKDKGLNNCTYDNKYEIDSEHSFRFFNNYNNITNNTNNINNYINDIPFSSKQNIFTKKILGGMKIKSNNNNNYMNKKDKKYNKINNSYSINNILKQIKLNNKEDIYIKTDSSRNNKFNGNYMELAKICENQEKIISNLVKNVQQLNSQICDKDLCINKLNNQLYSIKYDLLNTLQKNNNK